MRFDIVGFDAEGEPVLVVEVQARPSAIALAAEILENRLAESKRDVPFAMAVDLDRIVVFRAENRVLSVPLLSFATNEILVRYETDIAGKRIYDYYLGSLTERWLRDLAYRSHSDSPPMASEVASVGLLENLKDGMTESDADLAPYRGMAIRRESPFMDRAREV